MTPYPVVFPGTFDPITNGHIDLIERAVTMFPEVIVAVAENTRKKPHFDIDTRVSLAKASLKHLPTVKVLGFSVLLVDFVRSLGAKAIIRGLRALSDFEYEFQLANMNRRLAPDIETLFLTPSENYVFLSSSLVSEVAHFGGDVSSFVPPPVIAALKKSYPEKG